MSYISKISQDESGSLVGVNILVKGKIAGGANFNGACSMGKEDEVEGVAELEDEE